MNIYWDSTSNSGSGLSSTSVKIPTLGYKKADVTAVNSTVGVGGNRDISGVDSITISQQNNIVKSDIKYNPNGFYYTSHDSNYTVVLHN